MRLRKTRVLAMRRSRSWHLRCGFRHRARADDYAQTRPHHAGRALSGRAAASTRWRASSPTSSPPRSASRCWSTIAAAAAGSSARARCKRRARRLHAAARPHRHDLDQPEPLRQFGLRSAQGLFADRPDRLDAGRADRASVVSGEDHRRHDRAREKEAGQAQHRHLGGRHRRLYVGRTVQVGRRRRRDDRSLQGHGAGDERSARRPRTGRVRRDAARARQFPVRQAARDRGRQPHALGAVARRADVSPSSGLPGFEAVLHYGVLAPAGTPQPIVERLNAELRKLAAVRDGEEAHPPKAATR